MRYPNSSSAIHRLHKTRRLSPIQRHPRWYRVDAGPRALTAPTGEVTVPGATCRTPPIERRGRRLRVYRGWRTAASRCVPGMPATSEIAVDPALPSRIHAWFSSRGFSLALRFFLSKSTTRRTCLARCVSRWFGVGGGADRYVPIRPRPRSRELARAPSNLSEPIRATASRPSDPPRVRPGPRPRKSPSPFHEAARAGDHSPL